MYKALLPLVLLVLTTFVLPANAQTNRYNVTGVVVDTSRTSLPQATVVVLTRVDSVLTKFATSGPEGQFTLRRIVPGQYILQITYVGFATSRQDFEIVEDHVDVGTITLYESTKELDEILVSADHVPFLVKRDTLEYNANAFTTRPNDVVEDLLRRLPGIEVEADGSIKAQGETVENVLVDGKEFFSETPTVATKNLPAMAVDKVQVYDKQSDQAEFTGIPDGEEEKTIDLLLKEDAKRGVLGTIKGATGGEHSLLDRYEANASLHRFSPSLQTSFIGTATNTGQSGVGIADIVSMMNMSFFSGGGSLFANLLGLEGGGFTESLDAGINLSRDFGKRNWIRGSYFVNSLDQRQDSQSQRQELAGLDVATRWTNTGVDNTNNLGHVINLNAQVHLGPGHQLRARSSLKFNRSEDTSTSTQQTRNIQNALQNTATGQEAANGRNNTGSANLTWRKKLGDNGRTIVGRGELTLTDNDHTVDLLTRTSLATSGNVMTWEEVQQEQEQYGQSTSTKQRLSLTEPLTPTLSLELFGGAYTPA